MKSLLFRSFLLLLLSVATVIPGVVSAGMGQSIVHEVAGRSYRLYKPVLSDTKNFPLMIVLHGGLGNAGEMEKMTGMNDVADTGKFLVAYPEGIGGRFGFMKDKRTWNAGRCCGQAVKQNSDDVLFIKKLIDDVHARYQIDTRRVYVTGMSNGAMMAYRLACEISEKIAAIIPVSGTLAVDSCNGAKDIPVLHIHGDQDQNVPFSGGKGEDSMAGVSLRSVPETIALLIRSRRCSAPQQKNVENAVRIFSYRCSNGAPVELSVIKGGKHAWPGGHGRNNEASDGRHISASKQAWEFAKEYSKAAH